MTASTRSSSNSAPQAAFVRDCTRLLLTFAGVVSVDTLVVPFFTHQLRFWFPLWLDPEWASREHPWVVYSQSYMAGIFLIPVLAYLVARDFLPARFRGLFWGAAVAVFAFIAWWKGSLMLQFNKHWEALGFLALTCLFWFGIGLTQRLSATVARMTAAELFRHLVRGVATFFLVMAVLDPTMQLLVQRLPWSPGLLVEVGFFVPAGVLLSLLARRLKERGPLDPEPQP